VPRSQIFHTRHRVEPKVVIKGQGKAVHKPPITIRVSKAVIGEIEDLVEGPRYLAWEYVLRQGLEAIRRQAQRIEVGAETLE